MYGTMRKRAKRVYGIMRWRATRVYVTIRGRPQGYMCIIVILWNRAKNVLHICELSLSIRETPSYPPSYL